MQARQLSTTAARTSSLPSNVPALQPPAAVPLASLHPDVADLPAVHPVHLTLLPPTTVAEHSGLAHDAGNLLGALRLYTDLLRAPGVLRPEHQHYAAELGLIASRSTSLLQRLLKDPPLKDTSSIWLQPVGDASAAVSTNLADVLRTLAPVLERIAGGAARVVLTAPAALPPIPLPAEALERIAVNLVRNAAEVIRTVQARTFAPHGGVRGGVIRITLEVTGSTLRLLVEDNGPGMPPEVASAFLRPLPLPAGASRGLGHRIVHELVTTTGGKLSVRVRPGRGTTFCLRWPLPERTFDGCALEPLHRSTGTSQILPPAMGQNSTC